MQLCDLMGDVGFVASVRRIMLRKKHSVSNELPHSGAWRYLTYLGNSEQVSRSVLVNPLYLFFGFLTTPEMEWCVSAMFSSDVLEWQHRTRPKR